jgi:Arc-like DNA binding dprotein
MSAKPSNSTKRSPVLLRLPPGLKIQMKEKAEANERTLNAEAIITFKKHAQDQYRI